jgi:hypothetical protein
MLLNYTVLIEIIKTSLIEYLHKPFKGWESLDTEFFGNLLLLSGINLSKEERWIQFRESFSSFLVFWSK